MFGVEVLRHDELDGPADIVQIIAQRDVLHHDLEVDG
jgi:hypothetical protein